MVNFVARAEGARWRIWNRKQKRPWGGWFRAYPEELLAELNGERRQEALNVLVARYSA